jgi:hypothetical protein
MSRDLPITETKVVEFLKRSEDANSTGLFANVVGMIHPNALFRFNDGDYCGLEAIQRAFESTWTHDVMDGTLLLVGHRSRECRYKLGGGNVPLQLVGRRATRAISNRRPWYEPSRSARWQAQGHGRAPKPMNDAPPKTGSIGQQLRLLRTGALYQIWRDNTKESRRYRCPLRGCCAKTNR